MSWNFYDAVKVIPAEHSYPVYKHCYIASQFVGAQVALGVPARAQCLINVPDCTASTSLLKEEQRLPRGQYYAARSCLEVNYVRHLATYMLCFTWWTRPTYKRQQTSRPLPSAGASLAVGTCAPRKRPPLNPRIGVKACR